MQKCIYCIIYLYISRNGKWIPPSDDGYVSFSSVHINIFKYFRYFSQPSGPIPLPILLIDERSQFLWIFSPEHHAPRQLLLPHWQFCADLLSCFASYGLWFELAIGDLLLTCSEVRTKSNGEHIQGFCRCLWNQGKLATFTGHQECQCTKNFDAS